MFGTLLLYLGMLLIGAVIGYFELHHKKLDSVLGKLQIIALLFILFVMGIRLGGDERVMNALETIGMQSTLLAVGTLVFSVLFVYLGRKLMHLGRGADR